MNDVNASRAEAPAAVFALTLPYFSHSVRERSALPRHDASVTGVARSSGCDPDGDRARVPVTNPAGRGSVRQTVLSRGLSWGRKRLLRDGMWWSSASTYRS